MNYLECGSLKFPIRYIQSISYGRSANLAQTYNRTFRFKGYNPQEISVSLLVTPANAEVDFADVCKQLLAIPINGESSLVTIGGRPLCPQLEFSVTSVSVTPAADALGSMREISANITLSGSHVSKLYKLAHEDSPTIPKITLFCDGKSVSVGDGVSLLDIELHPMTCTLTLSISEGNDKTSALGWLDGFIGGGGAVAIEGYGIFYAASGALRIGDELTLELSIFPPELATPKTSSFLNTSLKAVILSLFGFVEYKADDITVDYLRAVEAPTDVLSGILRSCGLLASFRGDHLTISEVPETIPEDNDLSYFIDYDLFSAPTNEAIIRDGVHEFRSGEGSPIVVESTFQSSTNRAAQVLALARYKQHSISLVVPYDPRIRQHSVVSVKYSNKRVSCLVDDYSIDFITGQMSLTLCYI